MLVDATTADRGLFARVFDVCVIGSGPAGMTVARKLAARGCSVALMEGGGLSGSAEGQALYEGEVVGHDYYPLAVARLRMFGGSSGHWGGRCRELDPVNFEALPHHPLGAWPFGKGELDPYAAETDAILELPAAAGDLPLAQASERFRRVTFRQSPPVLFGDAFEAEIAASPRILCALNANLVDLRLAEPNLRDVAEAVFRSFDPSDPGFSIQARAYCLCLGGLETPRFLLNCCNQKAAGLGNEHDLVGRYFCEHLHFRLGGMFFQRPIAEADVEGVTERCFVPTRAFLEANEALSFALFTAPVIEEALSLPEELARAATCTTDLTRRLVARLRGVEIKCNRGGLRHYFAQPGGRIALRSSVLIRCEQALDRDSRVTLSDARDAFGQRRIRLDWRISELDRRTLRVAGLELGAHFAEQETARVRLSDWVLNDGMALPGIDDGHRVAGFHHMCTTRMSADPRESVVDADCRVHGLGNLYIGGSSVFASAGYANPTYTIVQLALRLGDHLAAKLQPGGYSADRLWSNGETGTEVE